MMQDEWRTINYEYNGKPPGTYVCFDDLRLLKERSNQPCDNIGLWKSGSGAITDNILYYEFMELDTSMSSQPPLRLSDELMYSASKYM